MKQSAMLMAHQQLYACISVYLVAIVFKLGINTIFKTLILLQSTHFVQFMMNSQHYFVLDHKNETVGTISVRDQSNARNAPSPVRRACSPSSARNPCT
jgi:hypothetical protein